MRPQKYENQQKGNKMTFIPDPRHNQQNSGSIRGIQKEIACQCWCTSKGRVIPLMIKLQDEDGEFRIIRDISIHSQQQKRYAGIPSIEYDCTIMTGSGPVRTKLIFYQPEGRWVINYFL